MVGRRLADVTSNQWMLLMLMGKITPGKRRLELSTPSPSDPLPYSVVRLSMEWHADNKSITKYEKIWSENKEVFIQSCKLKTLHIPHIPPSDRATCENQTFQLCIIQTRLAAIPPHISVCQTQGGQQENEGLSLWSLECSPFKCLCLRCRPLILTWWVPGFLGLAWHVGYRSVYTVSLQLSWCWNKCIKMDGFT